MMPTTLTQFAELLAESIKQRLILPPPHLSHELYVRVPDMCAHALEGLPGLNEDVIWGIVCSLAPLFHAELPTLYAQLTQRPRPCGLTRSVLAVLAGLSSDDAERRFAPLLLDSGAPVRLGLIRFDSAEIRPTETLRAFLSGRRELPAPMTPFVHHLPSKNLVDCILPSATLSAFQGILNAWKAHTPAPLTYLVGLSGTGRTLAAQHLAAMQLQSLLKVRWEVLPQAFDVMELVREARWLNAAVLLRAPSEGLPVRWQQQMRVLLESDVNVLVSLDTGSHDEQFEARASLWFDLSRPDRETRQRLWRLYLPTRLRASGLDDDALAFRFRGTGRDISRLARQTLDHISLTAPEQARRVSLQALCACAERRALASLGRLGTLEKPLPDGLNSLILPDEQMLALREVIARVRDRHTVIEQWGFGQRFHSGLGLVVLMSGPPGTGKTLSARAVASALHLPLYRVEISQIVSKWVGETEKNLSSIFDDAEASGAALLFDEADSLFATRTKEVV